MSPDPAPAEIMITIIIYTTIKLIIAMIMNINYEQAMAWLSSGEKIFPDELREFIETYFGIIQ